MEETDTELTAEGLPPPGPHEGTESASAFQHDSATLAQLAHVVDTACEEAEDMYMVPKRLRRAGTGLDPHALRELSAAFDYRLREQERPKFFTATLYPMDGDSRFPLALNNVSENVRQLWKGLDETVTNPIARARFADIVFALKLSKNTREAGSRAARAYLATIGGDLGSLDQAMNLVRSWSITREIGLIDLELEIADAMVEFAQSLLNDNEYAYAVLPVLKALTMPRRKGRTPWRSTADALLDQALHTYRPSHVVRDFADLVRSRAGNDQHRIEHASRAQIQAVLAEADAATDGMSIRHHLTIAATEARRLHITDLAERAEVALVQAPPIEWKIEERKVELTDAVVGRFRHVFERASTWQEILAIWFSTDAPSGDYVNNQQTARRTSAISSVRASLTNVVYRDGDLPARTLTGAEAIFHQDLARTETINMTANGVVLAQALEMIKDRFTIPNEAELEDFISSRAHAMHPPYARIVAKSLRLFLFGEFEAATHLVVPKIEAAARALLLSLSEPIYRTQVGDTDGRFLGLGALLPLLCDQGFDQNWERFFRTFLLSEGSNLRNLVAHGFVDSTDPVYAALALRGCALLVLITPSAPAAQDADTVRKALTQPHATVAPLGK